MKKLLFNIIAGFAGLWLAIRFIPDVEFAVFSNSNFFGFAITNQWQMLLLLGIILGLLNFFVKPILDIITLPLKVITLGIFSVVVNMAIIWFVDIMFTEITIPFWLPLLETSLIIWTINIILQKIFIKQY